MDKQRATWDSLGYNPYFQKRSEAEEQAKIQNDPNYLGYLIDSYDQTLPANAIQDGVMQSQNGNLVIDLNQGQLSYNDGVTNLLSLGGANNNMVLQNANGGTLLQS